MPPEKPVSKKYQIGYGKPPPHTRFRPGVSGNPSGRPRGASAGRANKLALKEAYRLITVREGAETFILPAIQAAMRQLTRIGLKGNGPALWNFIGMVQTIEQGEAVRAATKAVDETHQPEVTDEIRVKALAAFLAKTSRSRL
jgi:Family of unknown function (DUF5681)